MERLKTLPLDEYFDAVNAAADLMEQDKTLTTDDAVNKIAEGLGL